MRKAILMMLLAVLSGSAAASDKNENLYLDSLRGAKVIFCIFDRATRTDLNDGKLVSRESKEVNEMVFDSIDYRGGKARLVATGGQVSAFVTAGGATFLEGKGYTNHSFTTVFPTAAAKVGELVAVHSVHALIPSIKLTSGELHYAPEQRYGSCKVRP